jgi:hypothetical protein
MKDSDRYGLYYERIGVNYEGFGFKVDFGSSHPLLWATDDGGSPIQDRSGTIRS